MLARTHAAAGRLAAQRGKWREALGHYRQAIELGAENDVELRLGMLACHGSLYEFRAYRKELAVLAARRDLGPHRGLVRLHQGLAGFYSTDPAADPVGAFREALALGLPPAERSYAKAVLAATVPQMTAHLRETIRHDPFHVRAHDLLTTALLIQGRPDEAREVLSRFELLAPNTINGISYRVIERALARDLPGALRKCDELRPLLGAEGVSTFRSFARLMHEATGEEPLWESNPLRLAWRLVRFSALAPRFSRLLGDERLAGNWAAFNTFRLGILRPLADSPPFRSDNWLGTLAALYNTKASQRFAAECQRVVPMGLFEFGEGMRLEEQGKLSEAEAAYRRAIDTPSLAPVARRATYALMVVQARQARQAGPGQSKKQEQARATLCEVVRRGPYPAPFQGNLCGWALSLGDPVLALALAEDWLRLAPADPQARGAQVSAEYALGAWGRLARTIDLLLAQPADADRAEWLNRRTVAEFNQRRYSHALAFAFAALRADPANRVASGNLRTIDQMLEQAAAVTPYLREKVRLWRVLHQAQVGNHHCATAALADLPDDLPPETAVAAAAIFSRAAAAAMPDERLPPAARGEFANAAAARAVGLLNRPACRGYLAHPARAALLQADTDLDFLRSRPDCPAALRSGFLNGAGAGPGRSRAPGGGSAGSARTTPGPARN
jgi:tetratricopeptide (TPR) repeat protein